MLTSWRANLLLFISASLFYALSCDLRRQRNGKVIEEWGWEIQEIDEKLRSLMQMDFYDGCVTLKLKMRPYEVRKLQCWSLKVVHPNLLSSLPSRSHAACVNRTATSYASFGSLVITASTDCMNCVRHTASASTRRARTHSPIPSFSEKIQILSQQSSLKRRRQ